MCVQLHPKMGCPLGRGGADGGRFPPLPPSAPWFGCRGGFNADLALPGWGCIRPPSCAGEGRRGALGYRNRYFYILFLLYYWIFFPPRV